VTLATATANEQAQGPGPRGPVLDPTDEVGAFLAQKPSQITAAKAAELLVAAKPWEQTQLVSVIHARMGNQFLQQVIALLTPAQLDALHGKAAPDELASFPGLEDVTSTAPPAVDYSGVDERGGYAHHPTLAYQNYTQQYGDDGTQTRLEDADPAAAASRNAANRATLDASNVEDRIAGLERLRKSLPKTKASIALSGAITAELWDLQHDRNLLDSDPKTKPWIGNRVDIPTRKAIYPGHVPTDCTEYVDKVFREAMAQVGQAGLAQSVLDYAHATAKRARDGRELYSGVDMQRALCAKLGWKSAYIDESGDKAAVSRKGGAETFYRAPVATKILEPLSGDAMKAKRERLAEIPFAIITVNSGGHMKMLARGIVYECHWSETGPYLFEATPLEQESWSHTLLTAPAADIDKLSAP
jgi:hypothetical protein